MRTAMPRITPAAGWLGEVPTPANAGRRPVMQWRVTVTRDLHERWNADITNASTL
ncbi:MAG: hypothetical protein ACRDRO_05095 [Pseudonocardiaceae bacterium]